MTLVALILLILLLTVFTTIQTLYVEGMRLRARELDAIQYFKASFEERLKLRPEVGSLTFSICKHTCLILIGITMMDHVAEGQITLIAIAESAASAFALMVLFAYLVPQLLVRRTSGHWLVAALPFFTVTALIARPVVALLGFLHSLLDITTEEPESNEPATSAENIDVLITAGTEEGLIDENDRELIQSVVEFGEKIVREVMTARPSMVTIGADQSLEELRALVINEQYSRIPVYESTIDNIIGFVHVRDMFEIPESSRASGRIRDLMRPIRFVPETKPVNRLMREMQQEGGHMVIVIDEYGNTAGLVTMEDLLEVILGEIRDEHEPEADVAEDGHGGYVVSGNFDIARVSDLLEFERAEDIESTTIGGLITEWLGRVPKPGESIDRDGIRAEILASDEMRVEKVRLSKAPITEVIEKND